MEVVPALAAQYLGAFREAGSSVVGLNNMLTGADSLGSCCAVYGNVNDEWCCLIDG
jgi:hypothetical protein